jgi:pyrrolysine biosynthesis protein PylD
MTRLRSSDIANISSHLRNFDVYLRERTGHTLCEISCRAVGVTPSSFENRVKRTKVWVIPLDVGQGLIEGFAETVRQIVVFLGGQGFISKQSGVAGMAEAFKAHADIIMLADDETFLAVNRHTSCVADNAIMTARGFVAATELMISSLRGASVLVIGCGRVGNTAATLFVESGADVALFDIDADRSRELSGTIKRKYARRITVENELPKDFKDYTVLFDASPAENVIREHQIGSGTYVSAPGMPLGVDERARQKLGKRLLHDPLQIGVATMVVKAVMG